MKCFGFSFLVVLPFTEVLCGIPWSVVMPQFLSTVTGSCAMIPCTVKHPVYDRSPIAMWLMEDPHLSISEFSILYNSGDPVGSHSNYSGRVEFMGNLSNKQCSLLIKDIRKSDEGVHYFRVNVSFPWFNDTSQISESKISLSVLD
ncbi:sialoadhesin-like [Heptranchias perlo]|uniref:sialoadhesin-like n=1 Tax=Heptranchias perlo TaxID=212740 RepID=UPI00355977E8